MGGKWGGRHSLLHLSEPLEGEGELCDPTKQWRLLRVASVFPPLPMAHPKILVVRLTKGESNSRIPISTMPAGM